MNPDLLALVCASWEGKEPKLGTAYAADSKHLLTARHLLFQDGQPGRIEFLLYRDRDRGVWTAAEIAWQPRAAERDVALLQAAAPIERAGRANLSRALPGWNAQWTSAGFPRIGEETTDGQRRRDYVPLDGTVHAAASRPEQMQLAVDHWQVEPEDWRGLSGAPVFCDGELVGVIGSVPTHPRDRRVYAVPIAHCLRDEAFAVFFASDEEREALRVAESQATAVLAGDDELRRGLCRQQSFRDLGSAAGAADVARRLFALGRAEAVRALRFACSTQTSDGVVKVLGWRLMCPDSSLLSTAIRRAFEGRDIIRSDVSSDVIWDSLFAALVGRPWRPDLDSAEGRPTGRDEIVVPESGIRPEAYVGEFENSFVLKYRPYFPDGTSSQGREAMIRALSEEYDEATREPPYPEREGPIYTVLRVAEDGEANAAPALRRLKEKYPHVAVLVARGEITHPEEAAIYAAVIGIPEVYHSAKGSE